MSELNLQPDYELNPAEDTLRAVAALDPVLAERVLHGEASRRGLRRRLGAPWLRPAGDDGFHLFRVF
ncbi:MAG TPA: hypothetical protein VGL28_08950 [Steroidobacteraceae bacterium]